MIKFGVALAVSALCALAAGVASAYPEAGVDAQIRPAFGLLLHPPLHRHHYHSDYSRDQGDGRNHNHCWRDGRDECSAPPMREETVVVDCNTTYYYRDGTPDEAPLQHALDRLMDGGTLYIRGNTSSCRESLDVRATVTIAGEPPSAFAGPEFNRPTISPPDGAPCIRIEQGVTRVEIRDLVLTTAHGGGEACIEAWDTALSLTRTQIDYSGDGSAIYMSGVKLLALESSITANSYDPAIVSEGGSVEFRGVRINSASTGVELSPAVASGSLFERVSIVSQSATPGASSQAGLIVRLARGGAATLEMRHSRVVGFDTGLWFQQGVVPTVDSVKVIHSRVAVTSEAPGLTLTNSLLQGERSGVYVMRGQARVRHNLMFGFNGLGIDSEPGVDLKASDNLFFPASGCSKYFMTDDFCGCPEDLQPGLDGDDGPGVVGWAGLPAERRDGPGDSRPEPPHMVGLVIGAIVFWRGRDDHGRDDHWRGDHHDDPRACRRYHDGDHRLLWPR